MTESELFKLITDYLQYLENLGQLYWFHSPSGKIKTESGRYFRAGKPGVHDLTVCFKGRYIGIELKSAKGRQKQNQVDAQISIEENGGLYIIARSLEDVENIFKEHKDV